MKKITVLILGSATIAVFFSGCIENESIKKEVHTSNIKGTIELQLKDGINDKEDI